MSARELIDGFDLPEYLRSHGGHETAQDGEWTVRCPICGRDDNKLIVNMQKRSWHCWVCEQYTIRPDGKRVAVRGAGGLIALIQVLEGCDRDRAVALLVDRASYVSVPTDQVRAVMEQAESERLAPAPEIPPPEFWAPITHYDAVPYLRDRGISPQDVADLGIVYCYAGRYMGRIIFPVWERRRLVYYQARATWEDPGDGRPFIKAMNPPRVPGQCSPREILMGLDRARRHPRVAVTEGPVDLVHTGPSATCTFGKRISDAQILKLWLAGVRAVDLMWDGPTEKEPDGAWPEMVEAGARLAGLFDTRLVRLPWGDPGLYEQKENDKFRAHGVSVSSTSRLTTLPGLSLGGRWGAAPGSGR